MSGVMYDYMETYIRSLLDEKNEDLLELENYARNNGIPIVQKETANFLKLMINMNKPKRVLELGTAIGYSSILMSKAANDNIHITTIERNDNMIEQAQCNILRYNLNNKIKIVSGDCEEALESLCEDNEELYDLIFIDAGKGHYGQFLPLCLKLLSKDGVIIADNVLFRGMVASKDLVVKRQRTIVKRMRAYLEDVCSSEEFITSVIPMGDGIAVTMRRN